ncbi:hypothetical protein HELRODRAFT_142649, partial [Helobdella robusta]|uniref:Protein kinase domain-containing protein n=1 Tax=Helobdella robusta TaxID=6412 RepID=T1EJ66_HELRO
SFLSIYELVSFYKKDRENLITRLRRPLKESKLPITPGYHYPQHLEVSKKSIRLFGEIISRSKFCVTCKGNYGHQMVLVKALQHYLVIENEDDFLEEARTMMKLDHQNIAKLLGVCFRTRPYYIILENFNCGTLKNALSNGIIQPGWPEMLIDISLQILSAMVYLEKLHYLLHRNLKSSNFLISSEYSIKLFDFERARLVDDDCYRASPQDEVSIRWSAPEVFLHSLYSTKSDVWSVGVVLWELFSFGQVPYSQLTESEVVVFISEKGKLEKPAECDIQMFSIMNQCWRYKPDMRPTFQSLEEKLKMQY